MTDASASDAVLPDLSPEARDEIRRVFSIFDADGSHTLDPTELRHLLTVVAPETPVSEEEVHDLLEQIDANRDGLVSLPEFEKTVGTWVVESRRFAKRRLGGAAATAAGRKRLHLDISGFFRQFRPSEDMEKRLREEVTMSEDANDAPGGGWTDYDAGEDPYAPPPYPTGKKLELLKYATATLTAYGDLVAAVRSNDAAECLRGIGALEEVLGLTVQFASPAQRYLIAQPLIQLFELLTHAEVPQRLVFIVGEATAPMQLKAAALRALALYTPGPRIAHTPVDNVWHPECALPKRVVVQAGILQHVVQVVTAYREGIMSCNGSAETDLLALCLRICGVLMEFNSDILDLVNHLGLRRLLLEICVPEAPLYVLRPASYALAVLCGHTHDPAQGGTLGGLDDRDFQALKRSLKTMLRATQDLEVYSNVCTALAFAMPYIQPGPEFAGVLLEHWASLLGDGVANDDIRRRTSSAEEAAVSATAHAIAQGADVATAARLAARAAVVASEETIRSSPRHHSRRTSRAPGRLSATRMHAVVCVATCLHIFVRLEGPGCLRNDAEDLDLFDKLLHILGDLLQSQERLLKIIALGIIDALTGTPERMLSFADQVVNSPPGTTRKGPGAAKYSIADTLMGGAEPLLPRLLRITEKDEDAMGCRTVTTLRQFALTAAATPQAVLDHDVVAILFRSLGNFRRHDDVLADVYHYLGPSFNFKLVQGSLTALETILTAGEQVRRALGDGSGRGMGRNPFVEHFGMDAVEILRALIQGVLRASESGRLEAWRVSCLSQGTDRRHFDGSEATLEEAIESLARAMCGAHEANAKDPHSRALSSREVLRHIEEMMNSAAARRNAILASPGPSTPTALLRPFAHPLPPPPPPPKSPSAELAFQFSPPQAALPNPWLQPSTAVARIATGQSDPTFLALSLIPLNFEGLVETVIPRNAHLADIARYASVQAGRSVQLAYRDEERGDYVALELPSALEAALAQAIRSHPGNPRPPLSLYVLAQFTDAFALKAQDTGLPSAATEEAGPTFSPPESEPEVQPQGLSFPPFSPFRLDQALGASPFSFHYSTPAPRTRRTSRTSRDSGSRAATRSGSQESPTAPAPAGSFAFAPSTSPPARAASPAPSSAHPPPPPPSTHGTAASFDAAATTGMTPYQKQLLKMCQLMKDRYRIDFSCFEVDRVWRIFKHYKTKYLNQEMFCEALLKEGVADGNAALQAFAAFDINGDGKISVNEFICCLSVMRRGNLSKKLRYAFKAFDINNDGYIDTEELAVLVAATTGLGEEASQQRAGAILERCDGNKDGRLSFEEFCFGVKHSMLLLNSFWTSHLHTPREGTGAKARRVA